MKFRENSINNKFYAFALAAVFALTLAGCGGGGGGSTTTDPDPTPMPDPAIAQRAAIKSAIDMASTAVAAVDNDSSDADVTAADNAVAAARGAITAATDVPAEEKTANTGTVDALEARLSAAKKTRMAALDAAQTAADAAMVATAAKLFTGIEKQAGTFNPTGGSLAVTDRVAGWDSDGNIEVGDGRIGEATRRIYVDLYEDEDATVAPLYGWEGKRFAVAADDTRNFVKNAYEAVVYSNVGEPTKGKKFGGPTVPTANDDFQYQVTNGELTGVTLTDAAQAERIDLTGVTRTAGTETFELPVPNPNNVQNIQVPGTFHGVPGTYVCDTGASRTDACTAAVAAKGFTLVGTWSFRPTDANVRLTDSPDANYASYGWWLRTDEAGNLYASAFHHDRGTAPAAVTVNNLNGTATYNGGAAGKYAIAPATAGTSDAGHFTARATLTAKFGDADGGGENNRLSGVIDTFMVGDGESRDWSVKLNEDALSDAGALGVGSTDNTTVWSIGGVAGVANDESEWFAQLKEAGTDGVPNVVTGVFNVEYGNTGKMVGGFGAKRQ